MGLRAINVYAVDTGAGLLMVDGGWRVSRAWDELVARLGSMGRRPEEITDVLVTHAHGDHYTLAVELRRRWVHESISVEEKPRAALDPRARE